MPLDERLALGRTVGKPGTAERPTGKTKKKGKEKKKNRATKVMDTSTPGTRVTVEKTRPSKEAPRWHDKQEMNVVTRKGKEEILTQVERKEPPAPRTEMEMGPWTKTTKHNKSNEVQSTEQ